MMTIRTYSELITFPTFSERLEYLQLDGSVGIETFGFDRYLNQAFYQSREWKDVRREVIIRDNGCDLGIEDLEIRGNILIHHMNPVTPDDIIKHSSIILDPEYLICVQHTTHNMIHYGYKERERNDFVARRPNDTCPWRK